MTERMFISPGDINLNRPDNQHDHHPAVLREERALGHGAMRSRYSAGRARTEPTELSRTCFEVDADRILHSKAFRRLAHKTQVFIAPSGDHYRTRITHTLEVAQIARTMARAMLLNETLTEAIVLGHDLGHTPFGHAGERVLARLCPVGFHHVKHSLRVVDVLENDGQGLNLTHEVRDGILKHSKGKGQVLSANPNLLAMTLEGQVVRLADLIAYVNHDLEDAIRAGMIEPRRIPAWVSQELGPDRGARLRILVDDVMCHSRVSGSSSDQVRMSEPILDALIRLRDWLFEHVYESSSVRAETDRAQRVLEQIWRHLEARESWFRECFWPRGVPAQEPLWRGLTDFIAGMTDRYALRFFDEHIGPTTWTPSVGAPSNAPPAALC